jgi:aspartyl-tRNA(Asn)/glutamyl-tRNA(Gln) amidotransferase subunit A
MPNGLTRLSATEAAAAIRRRRLSPAELTEAVLAAAERTQPTLNAFVTIAAEQARSAARAAEAAVARGDPLGLLHGIPFSVKDLTNTAGVRTTMGSALFADAVPAEDAVPVARLRAAGAILIGKTTTPEFGHKPFTDSPLTGATRNPWDTARTPGGSSGGAAAAVAAGLGPIALGTDGGGSVRIPAACCGVLGLKPTLGRVPHIHAPDLFGNTSYIGPMARSVADARLVLRAIEGPDPRDPYAAGALPPDPPPLGDRLDGLRIGWAPRVGNRLLDAEVEALSTAAVRALEAMGAAVEPVEIDLAAEEDAFLVLLQSSLSGRLVQYLPAAADRLDASLRETIERGRRRTAAEILAATARRTALYRRVVALFERMDVFATPTLSAPAPLLGLDPFAPFAIGGGVGEPGSIRATWYPYTYPFNLTGHPALSVPCGRTGGGAGLPVGLQLVGAWHADHHLLDLTARIEAARPWAQDWPPAAAAAPEG